MADGEGCTCFAAYKGECVCDADWTPSEVIQLRKQVAELEAINKQLEFRLDAWYESSKNAVQRVNELTAQLDKAREALSMASWNQIGGYDLQQRWLELNRELDK
jgi:hypothetical protein